MKSRDKSSILLTEDELKKMNSEQIIKKIEIERCGLYENFKKSK